MTDLQATLDAIDEVAHQECGHCRRPLRPDGPSQDFCGDWCQASWLRAKQEIVELVGYREPDDLAAHAYNLVELSSPETTPAPTWATAGYGGTITFYLTVDLSPMMDAFERLWQATWIIHESLQPEPDRVRARVVFDEVPRFLAGVDPLTAAVRSLPRVSQLPSPLIHQFTVSDVARVFDVPEDMLDGEPFGADFDFEHRPATTLPHEPPPAVMPALPERDWQALVDARTTSTGPERVRRAPRDLGRRR